MCTVIEYVICESADGWSLHASGATDEQIAHGVMPPLVSGAWGSDDRTIPDWAYTVADRGLVIGARVAAGHGEDYDTGRVLEVRGDYAYVAWDTLVQTWTPIEDLRVMS